mmetsp:Transcript_37345/g.79357  ORF Transcript_37345/g.79357 Transcript_37345/m.79357 type:complete len:211 (-) Transcript_37345:534-1166(-)
MRGMGPGCLQSSRRVRLPLLHARLDRRVLSLLIGKLPLQMCGHPLHVGLQPAELHLSIRILLLPHGMPDPSPLRGADLLPLDGGLALPPLPGQGELRLRHLRLGCLTCCLDLFHRPLLLSSCLLDREAHLRVRIMPGPLRPLATEDEDLLVVPFLSRTMLRVTDAKLLVVLGGFLEEPLPILDPGGALRLRLCHPLGGGLPCRGEPLLAT